MRAYLVSGPAGSGKSTLGRELARRTGAALVDLDVLTNPLLDAVFAYAALPGHWNDPEHRDRVRPARYAALLAVAADQVAAGNDVVMVAPFTAERGGGPEWDLMCAALRPARVTVLWLDVPPAILAERVRLRGAARDHRWRPPAEQPAPLVPHLRVDASRPTDDQVAEVLRQVVPGPAPVADSCGNPSRADASPA